MTSERVDARMPSRTCRRRAPPFASPQLPHYLPPRPLTTPTQRPRSRHHTAKRTTWAKAATAWPPRARRGWPRAPSPSPRPLPSVEIRLENDGPGRPRPTTPCRPTRSGRGTTTSAGHSSCPRGSGGSTAILRYGRTAARSTRGGAPTSGGGTTSRGERSRPRARCSRALNRCRFTSSSARFACNRFGWLRSHARASVHACRAAARARCFPSPGRSLRGAAPSRRARRRRRPPPTRPAETSSRAWVTRRRRFAARRSAPATSSCSMKADVSSTSISAPSVRGASEGTTFVSGRERARRSRAHRHRPLHARRRRTRRARAACAPPRPARARDRSRRRGAGRPRPSSARPGRTRGAARAIREAVRARARARSSQARVS